MGVFPADETFFLCGDLNIDPYDGEGRSDAILRSFLGTISQILSHLAHMFLHQLITCRLTMVIPNMTRIYQLIR